MVLDHAGRVPNPARDRLAVRLPREEPEEPNPRTADHLEAVYRLLPPKHRLPFLFLDWSGARVSAIDSTLVGDYDESRRRLRLRAATTKTRRALWVQLHPTIAEAIEATLGPREDRDLGARLQTTGRCATRLPRLRCLHEQQGWPEAVYSWGRNRILLSAKTTDASRRM
jgi:hypothetical protein